MNKSFRSTLSTNARRNQFLEVDSNTSICEVSFDSGFHQLPNNQYNQKNIQNKRKKKPNILNHFSHSAFNKSICEMQEKETTKSIPARNFKLNSTEIYKSKKLKKKSKRKTKRKSRNRRKKQSEKLFSFNHVTPDAHKNFFPDTIVLNSDSDSKNENAKSDNLNDFDFQISFRKNAIEMYNRFSKLRNQINVLNYELSNKILKIEEIFDIMMIPISDDMRIPLTQLVKKKIAKKSLNCSSCSDKIFTDNKYGAFDCGHAYHLECLIKWASNNNDCLTCGHRIYEFKDQDSKLTEVDFDDSDIIYIDD
jgi:hypothetical protein